MKEYEMKKKGNGEKRNQTSASQFEDLHFGGMKGLKGLSLLHSSGS